MKSLNVHLKLRNRKLTAYVFFVISILIIIVVSFFLLGARVFKANVLINDYHINIVRSVTDGFINIVESDKYLYTSNNKNGFKRIENSLALVKLNSLDSRIVHFLENVNSNSFKVLEEVMLEGEVIHNEYNVKMKQLDNEERNMDNSVKLSTSYLKLLDSVNNINLITLQKDSILFSKKNKSEVEYLMSKRNYLQGREKIYILKAEIEKIRENFNLKKTELKSDYKLRSERNKLQVEINVNNVLRDYYEWKEKNLIERKDGDKLLFGINSKVKAGEPILIHYGDINEFEGYVDIPEKDYLRFRDYIKKMSLKITHYDKTLIIDVDRIIFTKIPNSSIYKAVIKIKQSDLVEIDSLVEASVELNIIYFNLDLKKLLSI